MQRAEWIIATRLEKRYTKNEIIAMYFNKFDFLNTAVGIHSASKIYFNKTPIELTIQESAMLVGMAKNPSIYNPIRQPDKTLKRREVVLSQMKKNGYINNSQYDSLRKLPLGINFQPESHLTGIAPYFREHVRLKLKKIISANNIKICLDYHIKRCDGPCEGLVSENEYSNMINQIKDFLKGRNSNIKSFYISCENVSNPKSFSLIID